jgi:hypothetical protein
MLRLGELRREAPASHNRSLDSGRIEKAREALAPALTRPGPGLSHKSASQLAIWGREPGHLCMPGVAALGRWLISSLPRPGRGCDYAI